jgi:hypothetical protein
MDVGGDYSKGGVDLGVGGGRSGVAGVEDEIFGDGQDVGLMLDVGSDFLSGETQHISEGLVHGLVVFLEIGLVVVLTVTAELFLE